MAKNPADVARKWQRGLGSAGESVRAGVQAVSRNPAELAAAAQDRYVAGVQRAVDSGKFRRGLGRVTLQSWQQAMVDKGIPRMSSGATAALPKVERFLAEWLPYMDQLKQRLQSMPRGGPEENKARMLAAFDHNASFRRSG